MRLMGYTGRPTVLTPEPDTVTKTFADHTVHDTVTTSPKPHLSLTRRSRIIDRAVEYPVKRPHHLSRAPEAARAPQQVIRDPHQVDPLALRDAATSSTSTSLA